MYKNGWPKDTETISKRTLKDMGRVNLTGNLFLVHFTCGLFLTWRCSSLRNVVHSIGAEHTDINGDFFKCSKIVVM